MAGGRNGFTGRGRALGVNRSLCIPFAWLNGHHLVLKSGNSVVGILTQTPSA